VSPRRRGETVRINITMTVEELAEIDEAARTLGLDRSNFMRMAALQLARKGISPR
jgi:uncharacterized protein (DUF1778 family)